MAERTAKKGRAKKKKEVKEKGKGESKRKGKEVKKTKKQEPKQEPKQDVVESSVDSSFCVDSSSPLLNMVLVGFVCFVFGFFLAASLGVDFSGGDSNVTTTLSGATTTLSGATTTVPSSTALSVIVLNDERCAECVSVMMSLMPQLQQLFPDMDVESFDYGSDEGKELYNSLGLTYLPAILFDGGVVNSDGYVNVQRYLEKKGNFFSLRIGANFDPTAEICDNGVDDTGNGKVDCEDDGCKNDLLCREEKENDVQVFVMSDCPYGRKAIEALKAVVDNFGDALTYDIHYIAEESDGGFRSLHGQYEVDEDIIQLCVKEHSPDVWLDYLYCRSLKAVSGTDWKDCAKSSSVDVNAVQQCFDGEEGKGLLREDIKIAQALEIGASPTWIANNKYAFGGIDAETVRVNICKYNTDLSGCENTLSSDTGGVAAGGCG